jgi:hypothetical protein
MRQLLLVSLLSAAVVAAAPGRARGDAPSPTDVANQLTADEQAKFDQLAASDQAEAAKYAVTRKYYHLCALVQSNTLDPLALPAYPGSDFSTGYLTTAEKKVVIAALKASALALLQRGLATA